jgi:RNA polymerase sigma-70 factor (ECF subfamily)
MNPTAVETDLPGTRSFLEQALAGDAEAFGEVCRVYETRLFRQSLTLCGNEAAAEELAQDTLVEAWKCLRRYNGRCQFFTWLCAILLNRHRNTLRKKRPVAWSALGSRDGEEFQRNLENTTAGGAQPDGAAESKEQAALVRRCIGALPTKHQQVIYLRFYVDESLEGIAEALGCSVGTVKSRLFHALEKLRAMNAMHTEFENFKAEE